MHPFEELMRMSRRGVLGAAIAALLPRGARAETDAIAVLEAAAARILPSGDGPGAREANARRFIERQLATDLGEARPAFDQLARVLDLWAEKSAGQAFAALDPEGQDLILVQLARGQIPVRGLPQEALFRALHSLTLEAFLSDPVHGGNEGMVGWKSIGFAAPHLRTPGGAHGHGH